MHLTSRFACAAKRFYLQTPSIEGEMSKPAHSLRLSGKIDEQDVFRVLHDNLQHIIIYKDPHFKNDNVMKEFFARLLELKQLSNIQIYHPENHGDFWRIIYRRSVFKKLKLLSLTEIVPCSKASRLFAKYSSWCAVDRLEFYRPQNDSPTTSAFFILQVLSSCTNPTEIGFNGSGIEAFALDARIKIIDDLQQRKLRITTLNYRVNLKHLLVIVWKAPVSEQTGVTYLCLRKIRKIFEQTQLQYWKHIDKRNVDEFSV